MFRFSTFQKILFFDDSYGQIIEREQRIYIQQFYLFFFFFERIKVWIYVYQSTYYGAFNVKDNDIISVRDSRARKGEQRYQNVSLFRYQFYERLLVVAYKRVWKTRFQNF